MLREALCGAALSVAVLWLLRSESDSSGGGAVLSAEELSRHSAEGGEGPYVALLGRAFDVRSGGALYGPRGAYGALSGRDASRAFATGDFTPRGLVDDLSGLSPSEVLTVHQWLLFYSQKYTLVGKVVGRFYDEKGVPTEALKEAEKLIEEGRRLQTLEKEKRRLFPPCNSEWSAAEGGRVWCSRESGGISREWNGVPRKLFEPISRRVRCVCVRTEGPPSGPPQSGLGSDRGDLDNPTLREYEGCHPQAYWCAIRD